MAKPKSQQAFDTEFGRFVKQKRLEMNWTQDDLASLLGNNKQNISRIERGELSPTLYWCFMLASAFEMKLPSFLKDFDFIQKR